MAHGVHLDHELYVEAFHLAHLDKAVENDLPVGVTREVVVRDEEARHALLNVAANNVLHLVDGAAARLPPLHVDDGAEGTLEGQPRPGIKAGVFARSCRGWYAPA